MGGTTPRVTGFISCWKLRTFFCTLWLNPNIFRPEGMR